MKLRILATAGDGIGPAVTNQEVGVLKRSGHWFCIRH
jgi:isocitrate/isopropylmalate dehydrogenase